MTYCENHNAAITDSLAHARMKPFFGCNEPLGFFNSSLELRGSFFLYMHEIRYDYASEY
jgi:hypothetical protein